MPINVQLQMSDKNMKYIKYIEILSHCFRMNGDADVAATSTSLRWRFFRARGLFYSP